MAASIVQLGIPSCETHSLPAYRPSLARVGRRFVARSRRARDPLADGDAADHAGGADFCPSLAGTGRGEDTQSRARSDAGVGVVGDGDSATRGVT